jgi:ubiquinone/menaquinone biosynthesis C-methylase UbiE
MAEPSDGTLIFRDLLRHARGCWRQNQPQAALDAAWAAFDLAPNDCTTTALLIELLRHYPAKLQADRRAAYLRLLTDRKVEPDLINVAGWQLLLRSHWLAENAGDVDFETLIADLEGDELALTLLRESPVGLAVAERLLTQLRRWLLLSGQWRRHPKMVAALKAQAALNGGAWPFDESERTLLAGQDTDAVIGAYLPLRESKKGATALDSANPVTRAVATQYEGWPYPAWTRITVGETRQLPDVIHDMDAELAKALPVEADMLIAGCGTGRQAASVALRYPDARVTAIDVSEASLDYARQQCANFGIGNVRFVRLDLHDVAELNQRFHAIHCAGVLHHLPDPEQGFKLLAEVLHPGGVMHVMIYNRHQRLMVIGSRSFVINDLLQEQITDDLLRRVRQRFLEQPGHPAASYVIRSRDFATLAGTHDLLLHRHEEGFDIARIEHALAHARLRMLSFDMPTPAIATRYDAMFPDDPQHRDLRSWSRFERCDPSIAQRHYRFWCCVRPNSH